jgi:uncharacterized RDD family membrane protein YckC
MTDDSHYETLGVEPDASRDELRAAYRSRVENLESAREGKGVTESSLQANRDETARVRAAWNVLSDPFQRQRYDAQLSSAGDAADDGDADADGADEPGSEVELSGWRKLLAPPPPKQPRNGSASGGKQPPPARPAPQPTIPLPARTTLSEPRIRGMAMLFDISILLLLYIGIQFFVPQMVQSDYKDISDTISACNKVNDDATPAKKLTSDKKDCGFVKTSDGGVGKAGTDTSLTAKQQEKIADTKSSNLGDKIKTTQYVTLVIVFVVWMLYLVPITATTGRTLGMRGRRIAVLRVNGMPCGWIPAFVRFGVPCAVALAVPTLGPVIGLGIVLWGFRDPNRQGFHDKLAKTIVVNESR